MEKATAPAVPPPPMPVTSDPVPADPAPAVGAPRTDPAAPGPAASRPPPAWATAWAAFLLHLGLSTFFTWPLLGLLFTGADATSGTMVEDRDQNLWNLWWVKDALLTQHTNPLFTDVIYWPAGVSLQFHTLNLFNGLVSLPFQAFLPLPTVYNGIVFFSFVLTGWGTWLLLRYVLLRRPGGVRPSPGSIAAAAAVGSSVFAYSAYHLATQRGLLQLISLEWFPFYVLFLLRAVHERPAQPRGREAGRWLARVVLPAAGFLLLVALVDWYYVMYALLFTAFYALYLLGRALRARPRLPWRRVVPGLLHWDRGAPLAGPILAVALFLIVVSPWLISMVAEIQTADYMRPGAVEPVADSADLLTFFIPPRFQQLWGSLSAFRLNWPFGGNQYEVYLGYVALALAGVGLAGAWRGRPGTRAPQLPPRGFWLVAGLAFWWLALGPVLQVGGVQLAGVPMLYGLLERIPGANISRSPDRFTMPLTLCLAVLAAYGIQRLSRQGRPWRRRNPAVLGVAVLALLGVELWPIPYPQLPAPIPAYYQTLGQDPADYAILELPREDSYWQGAFRMYFQTAHHKRIFYGYISREYYHPFLFSTPGFLELEQPDGLGDLFADGPAEWRSALALYDTRYVVLYKAGWRPQPPPDQTAAYRAAIAQVLGTDAVAHPVHSDADLDVYAVPAPAAPVPFLSLGTGWDAREATPAEAHRWMGQAATLRLDSPRAFHGQLVFQAEALGPPRTLTVRRDGGAPVTLTIDGAPHTYQVDLGDVPAGVSMLSLNSPEPLLTPKELGMSADSRSLGISFSQVRLEFGAMKPTLPRPRPRLPAWPARRTTPPATPPPLAPAPGATRALPNWLMTRPRQRSPGAWLQHPALWSRYTLGLVAVLGLGLLLRLPALWALPFDTPAGPQATTAAFVRGLAAHGGSLKAGLPWNGPMPTAPTAGLPLYAWIAALFSAVAGAQPWIGRAVSVLAALLATALLFVVVRRLAGGRAALYAALFLTVVPPGLYYGRAYLPDALGWAAAAGALGATLRWRDSVLAERPHANRWGGFAAGVAGLAMLIAPANVALLPALVYLAWPRRRPLPAVPPPGSNGAIDPSRPVIGAFSAYGVQNPRRAGRDAELLAYGFAAVALAPLLLWTALTHMTDITTPLATGYGAGGLGGALDTLRTGAFYSLLAGRLVNSTLTLVGFLLLLAGIGRPARQPWPWALHLWALGGLLVVLVSANRLAADDSTLTPWLPALAALVGLGANWLAALPAMITAVLQGQEDTEADLDMDRVDGLPSDEPDPVAVADTGRPVRGAVRRTARAPSAVGQRAAWPGRRTLLLRLGNALVILLIVLVFVGGLDALFRRYAIAPLSQTYAAVGAGVLTTDPGKAKGRMVVAGPGAPEIFYTTGLNGWALPEEQFTRPALDQAKADGASMLVSADPDWLGHLDSYPGLRASFEVALLDNRFVVFDLGRVPAATDSSYFLETGHTLRGGFRGFWEQHGGVGQFGFPITEERQEANPDDGVQRTVQYFERALFELHPDQSNSAYLVQLAPIGRWLLQQHAKDAAARGGQLAGLDPVPPAPDTPTYHFFPESGHSVKGEFLKYWQSHGGVPLLGYPVSEELNEVSPADGKVHIVQYFERARLEWHQEFAGTDQQVQMGLVGREWYALTHP